MFIHTFCLYMGGVEKVNALRVNFSAGWGHASWERDGLVLNVSIIMVFDYNRAHSRMLSCSLITKKFSTNMYNL